MKTLIPALFFLLALNHGVNAQSKAPRSEFSLELSVNEIEIKPGETKEVNITLLRSKGYNKSNAKFGLSSTLPDDISVIYEPASGLIQSTVAKISVRENAKPGAYTLLLNCTLNNKSKATMLKLVVSDTASPVTKGVN
jgi:hypothetical protein